MKRECDMTKAVYAENDLPDRLDHISERLTEWLSGEVCRPFNLRFNLVALVDKQVKEAATLLAVKRPKTAGYVREGFDEVYEAARDGDSTSFRRQVLSFARQLRCFARIVEGDGEPGTVNDGSFYAIERGENYE